MTNEIERREMLQGVAGLIVATLGAIEMSEAAIASGAPVGKVTGKGVGDFDFLAGNWKIKHRRLEDGTTDEWQEFESGATVHRVLDGMGSI